MYARKSLFLENFDLYSFYDFLGGLGMMLTSKSLLGTTPNQLLFWEDVALAERKRMPPSKQF
jgi:hypothetical protein